MNAARKKAAEAMEKVDMIIEVLDARLPQASCNPMIEELRTFRQRPCLKILNKSDLADPAATKVWLDFYNKQKNVHAVALSCKKPSDVAKIPALSLKIAPHRGTALKPLRIMIMGIPNVGKSTLMNELIGAKVSITSRKAQTTRHRITGIQTVEDAQFVYVDTPGFQTRHSNALNKTLNRTVTNTLTASDVILYVIEAGTFGQADQQVLDLIPKNVPCILVINKSDRVKDKAILLPFAQQIAAKRDFTAVVPVSAKLRFQLENLQGEIKKHLPENPPVFGEDDITDRSEKFLAAEIVREKVFRFVGDELPYTSTVLIEKFEVEGNLRRVFAAILVERDTHKSMVIGNKGARLKDISTQSRLDMERLFGGPVYLEIWVKVKSGWADNEAGLRAYGYE